MLIVSSPVCYTAKHDSVKIFGYGSLVNEYSLLRTSPDATEIKTVYIKGFRRSFNLLTSKSHGPLIDQPYCVLDVEKSAGDNVCGIVFTITKSLKELKDREHKYQPIETEAFDFETNTLIGKVCVFSSGRNDSSYIMNSPAQARYLGMCLAEAKAYGQDFYQQFLSTTYIGDRTLLDFPELLSSGENYTNDLS